MLLCIAADPAADCALVHGASDGLVVLRARVLPAAGLSCTVVRSGMTALA
jgi:hypothetical protein